MKKSIIIGIVINMLCGSLVASHVLENKTVSKKDIEQDLIKRQLAERKQREELARAEIRKEAERLEQERQAALSKLKEQNIAQEKERAAQTKEEAQKQKNAQELQKKIDELVSQENISKQHEEDPRTELAYAARAIRDIHKIYAQAYDETLLAQKPDNGKQQAQHQREAKKYTERGDAQLQKLGTNLVKALGNYSPDEIKKIITTMELKPETQLAILHNLLDIYTDRQSIIGTNKTLYTKLIAALLETVNLPALQQLLARQESLGLLHDIHIKFLQLTDPARTPNNHDQSAEQLFKSMHNFTLAFIKHMVESLQEERQESNRYAMSAQEQQHMASMLLEWLRHYPIADINEEKQITNALNGLPEESFTRSSQELHDWLLILRTSESVPLLTTITQQYILTVLKENSFFILKQALNILKTLPRIRKLVPSSEIIKIQNNMVAAAADAETQNHMSNEDIMTVITIVKELFEQQWAYSNDLVITLTKALSDNIKKLGTEYLSQHDPTQSKSLKTLIKRLDLFRDQLIKLHTSKRSIKPNIFYGANLNKWDPETLKNKIFLISSKTVKDGKFVNAQAFLDSVMAFRSAYDWYENTKTQQELLSRAQESYTARMFEQFNSADQHFLDDLAQALLQNNEHTIRNFMMMPFAFKNIIPFKENSYQAFGRKLIELLLKESQEKSFIEKTQKLPDIALFLGSSEILMPPHSPQQAHLLNSLTKDQFEAFISTTIPRIINFTPEQEASVKIFVNQVLTIAPELTPERSVALLKAVKKINHPVNTILDKAITEAEKRLKEQQEVEQKQHAAHDKQ